MEGCGPQAGVDLEALKIPQPAELWKDEGALLALMREDNLDAELQKAENELDAFGTVHNVVTKLTTGSELQDINITADQVMDEVASLGYG